jgi:hypothetical protein
MLVTSARNWKRKTKYELEFYHETYKLYNGILLMLVVVLVVVALAVMMIMNTIVIVLSAR